MNFYWVNIGLSYDEVVENGFLWAPLQGEKPVDINDVSKGIRVRKYDHWTNVGLVKAGDIIFCNMDRKIRFIAVALADAETATRPSTRTFRQWGVNGNKVRIDIFPLPTPLSVDGYIHEAFQTRYNIGSKPTVFKSNGNVFQGYMASIPDAAGLDLLSMSREIETSVVEASDILGRDFFSSAKRPVGATTRQTIREARIGQGYFRQELIKLWKSCPVTGLANLDLLIASHMKPWATSDDSERLDPFNGFLFSPHVDRLFDKGLIGFTDAGQIMISPLLTAKDLSALNISTTIIIPIQAQHKPYLAAHRLLFGFK
ncbi:HNH endonuclease [Janthinobacterium sp. Ant5-2-1]|uniref:HNH endonuclease n=1 Tax=Janthinobacterium sp. Ant5-2-1 TaxID=1755239 RepID=UPI000B052556|nr:HNH endonuclease signature motif containing protein [Janthinobacterium sp. Ant5-2-1]